MEKQIFITIITDLVRSLIQPRSGLSKMIRLLIETINFFIIWNPNATFADEWGYIEKIIMNIKMLICPSVRKMVGCYQRLIHYSMP